ncbi:MAG: sensor histidine kinase, partial [Gemmatimonadaceae bacterium]
IYVASALALGVILFALGAALVFYQRRIVSLHREHARKMLEAQEEERAWVAREVHDDALQRVAMLQHELDEWTAPHDGAAVSDAKHDLSRQRITALREELSDLGGMLRKVAHRLHPSIVEHAGLVPALHSLAADIHRASGFQVAVDAPALLTAPVPRDSALIMYRIAQEALRNAEKHADANGARISVAQSNGSLVMTITDEGRGFDPTDPRPNRGLGIHSMSERARYAGGRFEVQSRPGRGTVVRVALPLQPASGT